MAPLPLHLCLIFIEKIHQFCEEGSLSLALCYYQNDLSGREAILARIVSLLQRMVPMRQASTRKEKFLSLPLCCSQVISVGSKLVLSDWCCPSINGAILTVQTQHCAKRFPIFVTMVVICEKLFLAILNLPD